MLENMTKSMMYSYLTGIFCVLIIISNILATKTLKIGLIMLPCSILVFPMLFIINDILSEIYGFAMTRNVIFLGFVLNIIAVVLFSIAIMLPSNSPSADAFATILGTTPRLFIAGLLSYLISNMINSQIMVKLKEKYYNLLFVRCITSTAVGETIDSVVFITTAFYGVFSTELIITMIWCQAVFKVLYEFIIYPFTRYIIHYIRELDDGELENMI